MNRVDVLLIVLLTPFALRGLWRGLCRESFGLAGLVGGAATAGAIGPQLAGALVARDWLSPLVAGPTAFAGVFVATALVANLLGLLADRLVRALLLGGVNRVAGAAFGLAKGAMVGGFLLLLAEHLAPSRVLTGEVDRSTLGRPLVQLAARLLATGSHPRRTDGRV